MKILYNRILPPRGFTAVMLFGIILARLDERPLPAHVINHEAIHRAQARECGGYLAYYLRYLGQVVRYGYRGCPFEMEAYAKGAHLDYLHTREPHSWKRYRK